MGSGAAHELYYQASLTNCALADACYSIALGFRARIFGRLLEHRWYEMPFKPRAVSLTNTLHWKAGGLSISSRTISIFIGVRIAQTWLYSALAFCLTAAGTAKPSSRQSISCAHAGHST